MASLDSLLVRQSAGRGVVKRVLDDTPVAIRLRYIGTGTVTSVTTTISTNIVMVTSDGGTDTYTFATYTTVGALVDAINNDGIFEARILDALRSDATDDMFLNGAITATTSAEGYRIWDVLHDTSAVDAVNTLAYFTVRVTPDADRLFQAPRKNHRVSLQEIQYYVNVNGASAAAVRVYECVGSTETLVWSAASVDATLTTINWASGQGKITGADGSEFVVRVQDATSITDGAGNFLQCVAFVE